MRRVFIGVGSNISPEENIQKALSLLRKAVVVTAVSPWYRTRPLYVEDQAKFVNLVVEASTGLGPMELLSRLQSIEQELGRVRTRRYGERTIDLDLLLYGDTVLDDPSCTLPHPRMCERDFVLRPLCDISPDLMHPVLHRTIDSLLSSVKEKTIIGDLAAAPEIP